jgi:hypothetical protein
VPTFFPALTCTTRIASWVAVMPLVHTRITT